MHKLGIGLMAVVIAAFTLNGSAEARGFGDNDNSGYYGQGGQMDKCGGAMDMGMEMTRGTAQMAVGTGEHWISWLEFNTGDIPATSEFLHTVFGWDVMPYMDNYVMWMPSMEKGELGCGIASNAEIPQQSAFYIYTPNIDAKLAEVEARGGSVFVPKMPIAEGMPNIAMFTDPSGVIVGLVDAALPAEPVANPVGPGASGVPGMFCALEVYNASTSGPDSFYRDLFGWASKPTMESYMDFNPGSGIAGVFQSHTAEAKVMAYIWSDDVQATLDAVEAAGGTTFGEAMSMENIATFGYFTAPGGLMLGLMGPAS
ncbi:MAG: hypothetical protein R3F46_05570 [bacterium]